MFSVGTLSELNYFIHFLVHSQRKHSKYQIIFKQKIFNNANPIWSKLGKIVANIEHHPKNKRVNRSSKLPYGRAISF